MLPQAGEIFEEEKAGLDEPSLSDFLADINDKDAQLRRAGFQPYTFNLKP
jgi:hypothetical protein